MESENLLNDFFSANENEIEAIIREYWIIIKGDYIINVDGSINVDGNVSFPQNMGLTELPLKFNKVTGSFDITRLSLKTLKGSPIEVGGNFDCSFNQLSSLEYAPKKVAGTFAFDNTVKSLYTGDSNCNFNKVELFFRTNIPELVGLSDIITKHSIYLPTVFKYQKYYDIWNFDKSLNEANFDGLIEDIMDGLE